MKAHFCGTFTARTLLPSGQAISQEWLRVAILFAKSGARGEVQKGKEQERDGHVLVNQRLVEHIHIPLDICMMNNEQNSI